jgi:carboxylate-amine ligase
VPRRAGFGSQPTLHLGVEEELLLVDPATHALAHDAERVLAAMAAPAGTAEPDVYQACLELSAPPSPDAGGALDALLALRAAARAAGATLLGAGLHPAAPFGEAPHVAAPRYRAIDEDVRGLLRRTPTCALHVHVSVPDADAAIRAFNGLREHLPLLQALAANSPFWHGVDSGLASARASAFRAYPRSDIPRAFAGPDDYEAHTDAVVRAADVEDYTFLWWDVRPHPKLGTVEVRAMDAQAAPWSVAGLAALVQGLAAAALEAPTRPVERWTPREVLIQSSFRASRDALDATLLADGARRPVRELAAEALALARAQLRGLGSEDALEGVERLLREGGGAARQRAAAARGRVPAILAHLVAETAGA